MKLIIDVSMKYLSLFLRLLMTGKLERNLVYFLQFMSRFKMGGDVERVVLENSR